MSKGKEKKNNRKKQLKTLYVRYDKKKDIAYLYWNINDSNTHKKIIGRLDPETFNNPAYDNVAVIKNRDKHSKKDVAVLVIGTYDRVNRKYKKFKRSLEIGLYRSRIYEQENGVGRSSDDSSTVMDILKEDLIDEEQKVALDILAEESNECLFITGSGGSGKTTLLAKYLVYLSSIGKNTILMSATGLAAETINNKYEEELKRNKEEHKIKIQNKQNKANTIHSALRLKVSDWYISGNLETDLSPNFIADKNQQASDIVKQTVKLLAAKDVIIIDEASMVSSNMMNLILCLKKMAENVKKGKIRLVMFGDFYQLSPVVKLSRKLSVAKNEKYDNQNRHTLYNLYKNEKSIIRGGTSLFCSKLLSIQNKNISKVILYEIKKNHRIITTGNISENKRRKNEELRESLDAIKIGFGTLVESLLAEDKDTVSNDLIKLNEAITVINKRVMSFSRWIKLKQVNEQYKNISCPKVVIGENKKRKVINSKIINKIKIKQKECGTVKYSEEEIKAITQGRAKMILPEGTLYKGMPVIISQSFLSGIEAYNLKHKKRNIIFKNGMIFTISELIFKDDNSDEIDAIYFENNQWKQIIDKENNPLKMLGPIRKVAPNDDGDPKRVIPFSLIEPAYSLTCHKVQGQTIDALYVYTSMNQLLDNKSLYVSLSRATNYNSLGINKEIYNPLNREIDVQGNIKYSLNIKNISLLLLDYFILQNINYKERCTLRNSIKSDDNENAIEKIKKYAREESERHDTTYFFLRDINPKYKNKPEVYTNWEYMDLQIAKERGIPQGYCHPVVLQQHIE